MAGVSLEDMKFGASYMAADRKERSRLLYERDKPNPHNVSQESAYELSKLDLMGDRGVLNFQERSNRALSTAGGGAAANPKYAAQIDQLRDLASKNPQVTKQMVALYEKNPAAYENTLGSLAKNMAANEKLSDKVIEKISTHPEEIGGLFKGWETHRNAGTLKTYIDGVTNPAAVVATASAAAPTQAKPAAPAGTGKAAKSKKKAAAGTAPVAAAPAAPAAVAAAAPAQAEAPVATSETAEPLTGRQAVAKLDQFLDDPKNAEFKAQIEQNGLRDGLSARIGENPDAVLKLTDPGEQSIMMSMLKSNRHGEFLKEFDPKPASQGPDMSAMMSTMGDVLKDIPVIGPLVNNLLVGFKNFSGIVGRLFGGNVLGSGQNIQKMLNGNPNMTPEYLEKLAHEAEANLRSDHKGLQANGSDILTQLGLKKEELDAVQKGRLDVSHVTIEKQDVKDPDGRTRLRKVASVGVTEHQDLNALANSVEGVPAKPSPVKPQGKLEARPLAQNDLQIQPTPPTAAAVT